MEKAVVDVIIPNYNKEKYTNLISSWNLDSILIHDEFIPKDKVKYYFGLADAVVQPYITATQSGITQVAYHFNTAMIVTNVGGLAEIVEDGKQGYVCDVNEDAVSDAILQLYAGQEKIQFLSDGVAKRKAEFSWECFVKELLSFMQN